MNIDIEQLRIKLLELQTYHAIDIEEELARVLSQEIEFEYKQTGNEELRQKSIQDTKKKMEELGYKFP